MAMKFTSCGFIIWFLTLLSSGVYAYYCDHDLCATDQYCCGDNLCCDYVYSLWYFWVGVALLVLVASACGGFYRYFYDTRQYVVVPYFRTSRDDSLQKQFLVQDVESASLPTDDYMLGTRKQDKPFKLKDSPYC